MSLSDLLRSFFGLPKFQEFGPRANEFRDPFWDINNESTEQWNDDVSAEQEYDVGIFDPRSPFNEPFEMLRRFEEMFQHFAFPDFPSSSRQLQERDDEPLSARDKMLKKPDKSSDANESTSLVAKLWDSKGVTSEPLADHDLDEEVASGKISQVLEPSKPDVGLPRQNTFFYNSVSIKKVVLPDGRIEEQKIVKDSDGNEETVFRRVIGDQSHLVKKRSNKGNLVITEEEYVNMDEKSLAEFEKKWGGQPRSDDSEPSSSEANTSSEQAKDSSYFSLFQKFLGYAP